MAAVGRMASRARPLAQPNPGVGALIVRDNRIIARGWTQTGGRPHAEKHALESLPESGAAGATLYVTLEPCAHASERGPACCDEVVRAAPSRVVIGQIDPDPRTSGKGIAALEAAGIATQVLGDPASASSLAGFLARKKLGRPYVTLKLAMTADGEPGKINGKFETAASFLKADLVDELHIYRAPILIGEGLRAIGPLGLTNLTEAHDNWQLDRRLTLGSDTFEAYLRQRD